MPAAETPETHRSGAVSITALARLTRVENALFIATATLFPGIMESTLTEHSFLFAAGFIAVFAAAAGSFALNDYTDRRADRRNMRLDRPLVTGDAESTTALRAAAFLFTAALVPAAVLPGPAAAFLAGNLLLLVLYNIQLKKVYLLKNAIAAWGFGAPFIFGVLMTGSPFTPIAVYFITISIIVGFAYEVLMDIRDATGDRETGVATIAAGTSPATVALCSAGLLAGIMLLDPLPAVWSVDRRILQDPSPATVIRARRWFIRAMMAGSSAYLLGTLL